ncbi:MFS transporter [Agrococcus sp. SL85]|uniref:MFS transporter n=1 Tax=Agrococcus sp. SL85 TaxID=2995141 RepID=UPI00226D10C3|nr:MFS transporter [Agrococcus sp. SL85]WAC66462.1 MFS transporter [Agrococcus sp. SL85]
MTVPHEPIAPPVPDHRGLWREPGFPAFWLGQGLSQLGAQFAAIAMPIVAVTMLHATDAQMGFLHAAETAAFLLVGLPAGAWLDRMRKRRVMIAADLVRVVAVATIPLLWIAGMLEIWHLFVVGAVVGVATVFFDVGYQSFVPVLVRDEHVGPANGALEATAQTMRLGGPAVAGGLLAVLSAPLLLAANALGFLLSALSLLLVRDREQVRPKHERQHLVREIGEGLRFVARTDFLVRIVGTTALTNLGSTIAMTLSPILILRILGLDPAVYGLLLTLGALGGLAGSLLATRIARRIGEGPALSISTLVFCGSAALLPLAAMLPGAAVPLLVAFEVLLGFGVLVYNIVQVTARQRICPKPLLGRMNASIRFVVWGVMPIGALVSGWLGTVLGTVPAIWIGTVVAILGALPLLLSPYARMRQLPTRPTERPVAAA